MASSVFVRGSLVREAGPVSDPQCLVCSLNCDVQISSERHISLSVRR